MGVDLHCKTTTNLGEEKDMKKRNMEGMEV